MAGYSFYYFFLLKNAAALIYMLYDTLKVLIVNLKYATSSQWSETKNTMIYTNATARLFNDYFDTYFGILTTNSLSTSCYSAEPTKRIHTNTMGTL